MFREILALVQWFPRHEVDGPSHVQEFNAEDGAKHLLAMQK